MRASLIRLTGYRLYVHMHKGPWWSTCGYTVLLPWMTFWPSREGSCLCLTLRPGPVPALPRCGHPQCFETGNAPGAAQGLQELRAGLLLHTDVKYLPQMQDKPKRRYLFVVNKPNKTDASAKAFLNALYKACPIRINKLLTDNGKEFTDRLFASRKREPSRRHEFDQLCQALGIEHRLTKPRTPRTMGWWSALMAALPTC